VAVVEVAFLLAHLPLAALVVVVVLKFIHGD